MSVTADMQPSFASVDVGDPAPWFTQRNTSNPNYAFSSAAGRYVVLCFFATAADTATKELMEVVQRNRDLFDDRRMCFFGVSVDPDDERQSRVRESMPGIRFFWDFDAKVSQQFGAMPSNASNGDKGRARRFWLVLDPTLRVMAKHPIVGEKGEAEAFFVYLRQLPPPERSAGFERPAPILILPDVFEPALCRLLINTYEREGSKESGFMREVNGKTVAIQDHSHKRRRDCTITDKAAIRHIQARVLRRINPEIKKVYAFDPTRMERYIVGCYAAEDNAHFRPHRDNTTKGTAHRRFAVSINLNDDFEGGEVGFPEYGPRSYKAPPGGAVVFPCALLHAVSQVTRGRRYAFLPFLYDDAAARIREENISFLEGGSTYCAGAEAV